MEGEHGIPSFQWSFFVFKNLFFFRLGVHHCSSDVTFERLFSFRDWDVLNFRTSKKNREIFMKIFPVLSF